MKAYTPHLIHLKINSYSLPHPPRPTLLSKSLHLPFPSYPSIYNIHSPSTIPSPSHPSPAHTLHSPVNQSYAHLAQSASTLKIGKERIRLIILYSIHPPYAKSSVPCSCLLCQSFQIFAKKKTENIESERRWCFYLNILLRSEIEDHTSLDGLGIVDYPQYHNNNTTPNISHSAPLEIGQYTTLELPGDLIILLGLPGIVPTAILLDLDLYL